MNLLQETKEFLSAHNLSFADVLWIGTPTSKLPRELWESILDITYDDSYGTQEIDPSLMVVGKDWWLEREEYDGSEWWEFYTYPTEPTTIDPKIEIKYQ